MGYNIIHVDVDQWPIHVYLSNEAKLAVESGRDTARNRRGSSRTNNPSEVLYVVRHRQSYLIRCQRRERIDSLNQCQCPCVFFA